MINFKEIIVVFTISIFIIILTMLFIIIAFLKSKIKAEKQLREAIYQTQEQERSRISIDLHDNIGAKLSAVKLFCESLRIMYPSDLTVQDIIESTSDTILELKTIITDNSGDHIFKNGLKSEIIKLVNRLSRLDVEFILQIELLNLNFNDFLGVNIYRILQELINNSLKHSKCSKIEINVLNNSNYMIKILYHDDGHGFNYNFQSKLGLGLRNIDTRIKMFNGSILKQGNQIEISFPLK